MQNLSTWPQIPVEAGNPNAYGRSPLIGDTSLFSWRTTYTSRGDIFPEGDLAFIPSFFAWQLFAERRAWQEGTGRARRSSRPRPAPGRSTFRTCPADPHIPWRQRVAPSWT